MKIKTYDGGDIDTDSLPDMEAMILEKNAEYVDWMCENKVPFYCSVIGPSRKATGGQNYNQNLEDFKAVLWHIDSRLRKSNICLKDIKTGLELFPNENDYT